MKPRIDKYGQSFIFDDYLLYMIQRIKEFAASIRSKDYFELE
jgi:hypothetical protein